MTCLHQLPVATDQIHIDVQSSEKDCQEVHRALEFHWPHILSVSISCMDVNAAADYVPCIMRCPSLETFCYEYDSLTAPSDRFVSTFDYLPFSNVQRLTVSCTAANIGAVFLRRFGVLVAASNVSELRLSIKGTPSVVQLLYALDSSTCKLREFQLFEYVFNRYVPHCDVPWYLFRMLSNGMLAISSNICLPFVYEDMVDNYLECCTLIRCRTPIESPALSAQVRRNYKHWYASWLAALYGIARRCQPQFADSLRDLAPIIARFIL